MGREGGGVKPHGKGIQLTIYYRDERLRPTLKIAPTTSNLRYAARLLAEIRAKIRTGTFEPADYFPEYRGLPKLGSAKPQTFEYYVKAYLAVNKVRLSPSTLKSYGQILRNFWQPKLENRLIGSITNSELSLIIGETEWKSLKTYNNWLSCLRGVFTFARADGLKADPTAGIAFAKIQRSEPDPLSQDEIDRILAKMAAEYADYFAFAFYTGLRPSEQIALLWDDCDLPNGTINVSHVRVVGVEKAWTKTAKARQVELSGRAIEALRCQEARSRVLGRHVWLNPTTGKGFHNTQPLWVLWGKVLRALGMRYRVPYQTRHTRATMMLMAGANPAWCAKQLGHSPEMFFRVYAKWIEGADKGMELAKIERFLTATKTPIKR